MTPKTPSNRLVGHSTEASHPIDPEPTQETPSPGFHGGCVLILDDGSTVVARRKKTPHDHVELLLFEADGAHWRSLNGV